jgi:hypothetical protein
MSSQEHVASAPVRAGAPASSAPAAPSAPAPSRHARKFRGALVALVAIAAAAVAAAVLLGATSHRSASSLSGWSSWQPPDGGIQGAQEIADFIAPYYRASAADQLAVVTTMNLNDPSNPLQLVIPTQGGQGSQAGASALQALPPQTTIAYNLCGVGSDNCAIGVGTPSSARLLLLRREALELALYTFKYISGIQTVVAVLPPGHTVQSCTGICPKPHTKASEKSVDFALAFDRHELQPWLERPLRDILPEALPPTVSQMPSAPEAELVSVITAHGLFQEQVERAQDGGTLIVLNPLPPQ